MKDNKPMDPEELFRLASEKYYKVYDFSKDTKKNDKHWIRVGILPDVNREIKWNFFDGERLISDTDFDKAEVFCNGRAVVLKDRKYNVLMDHWPVGSMLFDEWYDMVTEIDGGKFYIVEKYNDQYGLDRKCAFADVSGNIVSEWFSSIMPMLLEGRDLYCVTRKTGRGVLERVCAVYDLEANKTMTPFYGDIGIFWGSNPRTARVRNGELHNLLGEDLEPVFSVWSKKPVVLDSAGRCQLWAEDGTVYNADAVDGSFCEVNSI